MIKRLIFFITILISFHSKSETFNSWITIIEKDPFTSIESANGGFVGENVNDIKAILKCVDGETRISLIDKELAYGSDLYAVEILAKIDSNETLGKTASLIIPKKPDISMPFNENEKLIKQMKAGRMSYFKVTNLNKKENGVDDFKIYKIPLNGFTKAYNKFEHTCK